MAEFPHIKKTDVLNGIKEQIIKQGLYYLTEITNCGDYPTYEDLEIIAILLFEDEQIDELKALGIISGGENGK
jgi:hypothetical protein